MAKCTITVRGNLGRDLEPKFSKAGKPYTSLSVASTPSKRNAAGEFEDGETMWFNVLVFDELNPFEYVKGAPVEVTGTFTHSTFVKRDGSTGFALEVLANTVELVARESREKPVFADAPSKPYTPSDDDLPF